MSDQAAFYDVQVSMVTRYRIYAENVSKAVVEAQERAKFMLTEYCSPVISVFVESIRTVEPELEVPRYVKGE